MNTVITTHLSKIHSAPMNDIHAKKSVRNSWVLVVTELVISGTQCTESV